MGPDHRLAPSPPRDDPLLRALYDASGLGFSSVGFIGGSEGDDDEELAPLVELVSAEDDAEYALVAQELAMETANTEMSSPPPSLASLPPGLAGQPVWLTRMQRSGGKRSHKSNPNKARDERKSELVYLRHKVAELEAELGSVQAKRPRLAPCVAVVGAAQPPPVISNVWKEIARRQNEERAKAERENVRLKLVLENQLKVAKSLEKILNRKSTAKDIGEFVERNQMCLPTASATDAEVFKTLLSEAELLFSKVDSVFEANGLVHTEASVTNARVRSDAHTGVSLEIFANKLMPFGVGATGDAVWHHFVSAKEHTPFRCYQYSSDKYMHSSDDMVVENFILKLNAKGTDANFRCKQVLRRHTEQDRVVIVWRAAVEAFEFSDEPISGVRFHEDSFIVIKRPSSVPGDHTLLQSCFIFTPDFSEDLAGRSHPRVGAITDFVLASTAANVSSMHQMIENVLIEQAMKSRIRSAR